MDLYVMRADGPASSARSPTWACASFAPYFFPDSRRIIVSNYQQPGTSEFEIYAVDRDGSKPERISFTGGFNAFPQFSPDGKKLVFISNRNGKAPHEINVFLADWAP